MDTFVLSSLNQLNLSRPTLDIEFDAQHSASQQMEKAQPQRQAQLVVRYWDTFSGVTDWPPFGVAVSTSWWSDSTSHEPAAVKLQSQSADCLLVLGSSAEIKQ